MSNFKARPLQLRDEMILGVEWFQYFTEFKQVSNQIETENDQLVPSLKLLKILLKALA